MPRKEAGRRPSTLWHRLHPPIYSAIFQKKVKEMGVSFRKITLVAVSGVNWGEVMRPH